MEKATLPRLPADVLIIGLTGALGSGCTYVAEELAEAHRYKHYGLSELIHKRAKEQNRPESYDSLQDIGNELRRSAGTDCLVRHALEKADSEWPAEEPPSLQGIIIDGIRNVGEVEALRQFPNFFLLSVQADRDVRKRRLTRKERFATEHEFELADQRDGDEHAPFGQQVLKCNDLANVVLVNDGDIAEEAGLQRRTYVEDEVYKKHVYLLEQLSKGATPREPGPSVDETMMTVAYCESARSSCVKRKVGAVISAGGGQLVSAGHNDVPEGAQPCYRDPAYGWCARDLIQERAAKELRFCPRCGDKIEVHATCASCGRELTAFAKRCPYCRADAAVEYSCPGCRAEVFQEFLPGGPASGGKLLDMCRAIHAEEYAILNLTRSGTPTPPGAVMYTTTFPCNLCANKIVAAGIARVVYAEPYVTREAHAILKGKDIQVDRFRGVKSGAYFRMYRLCGEARKWLMLPRRTKAGEVTQE